MKIMLFVNVSNKQVYTQFEAPEDYGFPHYQKIGHFVEHLM
jgi:hypothetical protein